MRIVMTHGVFDVLHMGHVFLLRQARELGDQLVVSVVADARITKPGRPVTPQSERIAILKALRDVNRVVLCEDEDPCRLIVQINPKVWVRGADYLDRHVPENEILDDLNIRRVYVPLFRSGGEVKSSSGIIQRVKL